MSKPTYSIFNKVMQKFASTRIGSWFSSRVAHHFDRLFLQLSDGRTTMSTALAGMPIVVVTSIGAKSGLPRTHPLARIHDQNNPEIFAVVASNWGQKQYPAWYFNLKANPRVTCSIDGQEGEYVAHQAEGEEYERFWQSAEAVYRGFPNYKQRVGDRDVPIMVMMAVVE